MAIVASVLGLAGCDREIAPPTPGAPADAPANSQGAAKPVAAPPPAAQPAAAPQEPTAQNGKLPSLPKPLPDAAITARVKSAIDGDPSLRGADVSVNTDRGVVTLTGRVASQEQAAQASAHAQAPQGVMRVDSDLAVTPR